MTSQENRTMEQRGDSPLRREVGAEGRAGCRHRSVNFVNDNANENGR